MIRIATILMALGSGYGEQGEFARALKYHREALEKTDQVFQMKLHETKLRMLEDEIAEIAKKKADIEKTLSKLKKQMARNEPSSTVKESSNQGGIQEDTKGTNSPETVSAEESTGEPTNDGTATNTSVQESSDKSQPAEG